MTGWHGRLGGRVVSREDGLLLHLGLRALGPWGPPSTLGWLQGAVALRAPQNFWVARVFGFQQLERCLKPENHC